MCPASRAVTNYIFGSDFVDARFSNDTGILCGVHDTVERRRRHLSFFEHTRFLHCAAPCIKTPSGKVVTVPVPWARPGSGFTLVFEALALALIEREIPVNRIAETPKRRNAETLKVNP